MTEGFLFAIIFVALLGAMFFSGSETGVLSANVAELRRKARKGSKQAHRLEVLLRKKDVLLATLLIGTNLMIVAISALVTSILARRYGDNAPQLATVIVTPFVLVFAEIIPKAIYLRQGQPLLLRSVGLIRLFVLLFQPLTHLVILIPRMMNRSRKQDALIPDRDALQALIRTGAANHALAREEQIMVENLLKFRDKQVRLAMEPLVDSVTVPVTARICDVAALIYRHGISRLPVYDRNQDNIVGIVDVYDLIDVKTSLDPIRDHIRKPLIVPEQKKITELLTEMWGNHKIAIVVDEYGVPSGIITIEDIVEEIVGDIQDEHDRWDVEFHRLVDDTYIIDAGISVDNFNQNIQNSIPPGDYVTLAGFLTNLCRKIPANGEKIKFKNMVFTVLESTPRRIVKLLLRITA